MGLQNFCQEFRTAGDLIGQMGRIKGILQKNPHRVAIIGINGSRGIWYAQVSFQ